MFDKTGKVFFVFNICCFFYKKNSMFRCCQLGNELPRDAMHNRGLCCRPVSVFCQSVRDVGVLYPHDWRYRQTSFSAGSSIILDFWASRADTQFQGEPLYRRRKVHGGRENLRFSTRIAVYLGNRGCYGTLIESHRWRIDPCRFRWPWMTLKSATRGVKFQADLLNNARIPLDLMNDQIRRDRG